MAADRELQRKRAEDAKQRGREVLQFNALTRIIAEEERRVEKEQDAILLQYALQKEREAAEAEEAKRNSARNAAAEFRRYLEEQMVKEAQNDAHVDAIRRAEEEKVWKARDDALEARRVARENLMRMVDEGRQEQIEHRRRQLLQERVEGEEFARKFVEDAKIGIEKERSEVLHRRELAVENNEFLQRQISQRQDAKERERQVAFLEDKRMKYIERQHQQKLSEQGGSVRTFRPLTKNNWYS